MLTNGREPDRAAARKVKIQRVVADGITPIAAYRMLAHARPGISFLFESAPGPQTTSRYSIMGLGTRGELKVADGAVTLSIDGVEQEIDARINSRDHRTNSRDRRGKPDRYIFEAARELLRRLTPDEHQIAMAPFLGAYGAMAFEFAGYLERLPDLARVRDPMPDLHLVVPETLVVFDHFTHHVTVATLADGDGRIRDDADVMALIAAAQIPPLRTSRSAVAPVPVDGSAAFQHRVAQAKEAIFAGEAFQIVLSQRWSARTSATPFNVYRALRTINPAPYMFYLDMGWGQVFGSSPEALARLDGRRARVRPLAGTRRRGNDPEQERRGAARLRRDPKERAEHTMLVDLGRNDLGRVCRYGSVRVMDFMSTEYYSHVMHLVSEVAGELREGCDAFDLFAATFPAGTVSGAPKIRAMELIAEFEGARRGYYAGSVAHFGFGGAMEACITLRSAHCYEGEYHLQAGAGIVADSEPAAEDRECQAKAQAVVEALRLAGGESV